MIHKKLINIHLFTIPNNTHTDKGVKTIISITVTEEKPSGKKLTLYSLILKHFPFSIMLKKFGKIMEMYLQRSQTIGVVIV